jgi:hypothetical protein
MTLPKEDLNLIAQIDARLKHYNLIQPIDTTEGEYVRCVKSVLMFEEGHIYKLSHISKNNIEHFVMCRNGIQQCSYEQYRMFFYPATHAEFLAQEQAPIETEQRWQPSYGVKYWYIGSNDGQFFVADFHWGNDDVDFVNHDTGNCFKSREAAQKAAEAIKQYLSTNKF